MNSTVEDAGPQARLAALRSYGVLDTPREPDYDDLVRLASTLCSTPFAAISLVDEQRQWFKAEVGLGLRETPIDASVCARIMLEPDVVVIRDLTADHRFVCNPLVTGEPHLRFYAGAPLRTPQGQVLGALCVLDRVPRELDAAQREALAALSRQVVALLELRRHTALSVRRADQLSAAWQQQERTQRALQRSEEAHRFVVEHVLAGLVVRDAHGRVLLANAMAQRLLGLSLAQLQGDEARAVHWHCVDEDGKPLLPQDLPEAVVHRTGAPLLDFVMGVVDAPRAQPRWLLVNAHPELEAGGELRRTVVSFIDISARKRSEDRLRQADRLKDAFLATLAHELRNPLAPMRSAAEVLGWPGLAPHKLDWCREVIVRQVGHMARLLDDLLDVSRITQGKLDLREQEVALQEVLDAALEVARPLIERKGHALHVDAPLPGLRLRADGVRLSQVLANLLNNAAKYTDDGGLIELSVRLEPQGLTLSVKDSGIGLDAKALNEVFDMFAQVPSARHKSEGGLGIGLALARGLVALHQGELRAESEGPGRGSCFTVRLPRARVLQDTAVPRPAAPQAEELASDAGRRVLVVDDNRDAGESLMLLLESFGHQVQLALDGPQALRALGTQRFDVALIDIAMPGMSGYEVAQRARAEATTALPLLVALTGMGQAQDKERAHAAGFDLHLTKPVDLEDVLPLLMQPAPRRAAAALQVAV